MKNTLACPKCNYEIELTELMRTQVASQIQGELDAQASVRQRELDKQHEAVVRQQRQLDKDRDALAEQVRAQVELQRTDLLVEARKRAEDDLAVEIADRDERLKELTGSLASARQQELELRKMQRQLQSDKDALQLEVQRQLDSQRKQLILDARVQFEQEYELKQAEKDKTISDMTVKLREMQRKIEQGSQQLQGEVQELALEKMLAETFPVDEIASVGKGICGGDCIQITINSAGTACGRILWESKRTRNWSNTWLSKARDDQREAMTDCVVIVSESLPEGVRCFARIEGVWVCGFPYFVALANALRFGLLETGKARAAVQGQNEKMELVYNFITSIEFQQRVSGIVEAFVIMQSNLEAEKRSASRIWAAREKQIRRAITNTACLYGSLQGLIGVSLPKVEGLQPQVPLIEEVNFQDENE